LREHGARPPAISDLKKVLAAHARKDKLDGADHRAKFLEARRRRRT
jgi:hypothetical protein